MTNGGLTDCSESSENQTVAMVQDLKTEKAAVDVLSETATLGVAVGQVEASSRVTAASCGIVAKHRVPKRRAFRVVNVIGIDEPSTEFIFPMLQKRTNKSNTNKVANSTDAPRKKTLFKESGNQQSILDILDRAIGTTENILRLLGEDS